MRCTSSLKVRTNPSRKHHCFLRCTHASQLGLAVLKYLAPEYIYVFWRRLFPSAIAGLSFSKHASYMVEWYLFVALLYRDELQPGTQHLGQHTSCWELSPSQPGRHLMWSRRSMYLLPVPWTPIFTPTNKGESNLRSLAGTGVSTPLYYSGKRN